MLVYTGEAIYAFVTLTEGATMTPEITKGLKTVCVCVCVCVWCMNILICVS